MNVTDVVREYARSNPDAEAVIRLNGRTVSYRELDRTVDVIAAAIRGLGFGPGAIAGIKTSRRYREMCIGLALARLGIGIAAKSLPVQYLSVCLTDGTVAEQTGVRCERLDHLWSGAPMPTVEVAQVQSHQNGESIFAFFPVLSTAGTRMHVALSHELIETRRLGFPTAQVSGGLRQICTFGAATYFSLFQQLRVLSVGGTIVMTEGLEQIPKLIDRHRVNRLVLVRFSLQRVLQVFSTDSGPLPWLQEVEIGSDGAVGRLSAAARRRLCANIVCRYGSPATGTIASARIESLRGHAGAVGYVDRRVQVQAVDAQGEPLRAGTEGRLRIRSDGCVSGYFDDPAASARVFRDGWFYSGDIGTVTPDGLLCTTRRAREPGNGSAH